ncbi:MAG: carboxypeptidase-like regulatory domain-containing protein [Bacteroidetes bacterium]|nr:carboxypeptidase-like regulatory domain-containing protein [Bacteroidota bacterium]MCY4204660.1 carboxypeptidase-like regulatory domain-containing protein [Bacteroidota bacterium]
MQKPGIDLLAVCFCVFGATAQESLITVSGIVTDSETGELIVGATLYVIAQEVETTTNQYGYYSLPLRGGSVKVIVSHVAYSTREFMFFSREDYVFNITLDPSALFLGEAEVTAMAESALQSTQMSGVTIPVQDIENLPTLLGKSDVLRITQLIPGRTQILKRRLSVHRSFGVGKDGLCCASLAEMIPVS